MHLKIGIATRWIVFQAWILVMLVLGGSRLSFLSEGLTESRFSSYFRWQYYPVASGLWWWNLSVQFPPSGKFPGEGSQTAIKPLGNCSESRVKASTHDGCIHHSRTNPKYSYRTLCVYYCVFSTTRGRMFVRQFLTNVAEPQRSCKIQHSLTQ